MAFITVLVDFQALCCAWRGRHADQLRAGENEGQIIRTDLLAFRTTNRRRHFFEEALIDETAEIVGVRDVVAR
jgi:gluconate kinase